MSIFLKKPDGCNCVVDNDPRSVFNDLSKKNITEDLNYQKGYIKGKEDGVKLGRKSAEEKLKSDYENAFKNIEESVEKLNRAYKGYLDIIKALQSNLPKLIIAVAEKLIEHKLSEDDGAIVKSIIERLSEKITSEFVVYVSENDKERLSVDNFVSIKANKTLKPGEVVLDWKQGHVDGRFETKIKNLKEWIEGINLEEFISKD